MVENPSNLQKLADKTPALTTSTIHTFAYNDIPVIIGVQEVVHVE